MKATLFSQVPIMQFQKQGIKYIYLYSVIVFLLWQSYDQIVSPNKRLLVANIAPYMFTYKIVSNSCNLNYNINLYLIHFTSFPSFRSRIVIKRLSRLKSTPLPPSPTEHKIYFMVECHIVICLTWLHGCMKKGQYLM